MRNPLPIGGVHAKKSKQFEMVGWPKGHPFCISAGDVASVAEIRISTRQHEEKATSTVRDTPRSNQLQPCRRPSKPQSSSMRDAFLAALHAKCRHGNDHDRIAIPTGTVEIGELRQVMDALTACTESTANIEVSAIHLRRR